jgi:hypothetical protein
MSTKSFDDSLTHTSKLLPRVFHHHPPLHVELAQDLGLLHNRVAAICWEFGSFHAKQVLLLTHLPQQYHTGSPGAGCAASTSWCMRMLISLLRAACAFDSATAMARVRAITPVRGSALQQRSQTVSFDGCPRRMLQLQTAGCPLHLAGSTR